MTMRKNSLPRKTTCLFLLLISNYVVTGFLPINNIARWEQNPKFKKGLRRHHDSSFERQRQPQQQQQQRQRQWQTFRNRMKPFEQIRFSSTTVLQLAINFNNKDNSRNDKDKKDKKGDIISSPLVESDDNEDEDDFSLFMEGLKQWPLYPIEGSDTSANNSENSVDTVKTNKIKELESSARSSGRYRGINQLGNFFRFEAILDLATSGIGGISEAETSEKADNNSNGSSGNNKNNETYFSSIFSAADQLVKTVSAREATTVAELLGQANDAIFEDTLRLLESSTASTSAAANEEKASSKSVAKLSSPQSAPPAFGKAAGAIVKDASARFEYLVTEASAVLSKNSVQDLIIRASMVFSKNGNSTSVEDVTNDIVKVAKKVAQDQGLDAQFAADRARETTNYAANMLSVANCLFGSGYAYGSRSGKAESVDSPLIEVLNIQDSRPLFADAPSARRIDPFQYKSVVIKGAEMGTLAGAIYENVVTKCHKLGHSLVANGTVADVSWMVTDSIDYESSYTEPDVSATSTASISSNSLNQKPIFVRTITLRGFDASDESVDRERLLNTICKATGEPMSPNIPNVLFHSGLLSTARAIYNELKMYISWTSPNHKLVLNGHSIGGALSVLVLLLFVCDKGADYVKERVLRVYTHGSPPVSSVVLPVSGSNNKKKIPQGGINKKINRSANDEMYSCPVLEAFNLPQNMVYGYVQPYDPIVRFLTEYDPLYPLVDDLGEDEVTLYSTGPPRSLRPVTRALLQSWDGWPEFRENWKSTNQKYHSVGIQHLLLPEPLRYLNDRFVSTNVGVPPTETIVRISSRDMLPALNEVFPLDVFQISLIPQAVRSFLHHFYPAYDFTIANYAAKLEKEASRPPEKEKISRRFSSTSSPLEPTETLYPNRTISI